MPSSLDGIFDVRYGHSLELNALSQVEPAKGIAFVSRQMGENGISAYVAPIAGVAPAPAGDISCALGGNGVLTTFVQEREFYCGRDVAILRPKVSLSKQEILFYCLCIKSNRFRYSYGRQANKTLGSLSIPSVSEIPNWVNATSLDDIDDANASLGSAEAIDLPHYSTWKSFNYTDLFKVRKGKRITKSNLKEGSTPFIGAIDSNNGYRQYVDVKPNHPAETITVNYNGNGVADAYYQEKPFWASDDVNVLYPKFEINSHIAMFVCTLIRQEKFRFSYGREWHLERMNGSTIRLPVNSEGKPDWFLMEKYIKSLPFSASI
ncbi:MAG: restriction endonuclease subunit S [Pseudomonadota bacterium]